jgi:hypothetical protein
LGIVERLRRLGWAADLVVSPQPWRLKTFDHYLTRAPAFFVISGKFFKIAN